MKGILLAGGNGKRLYPLTRVVNKHLLPIGKKPMIFYPLEKLVRAGIQDILIVTGTEHLGMIVETLGSGKEYGYDLTYRVQDEAGGIAQALGLAKGFVGNNSLLAILGDNLFEDDLRPFVQHFREQTQGARILLKDVPDPERFGVAEVSPQGKILSIEEKPKHPKSTYAVIGVYAYDARVFEIIRELRPSARGEMEISDVNLAYLRQGQLEYDLLSGWWSDAGTFDSLKRAADLVQLNRVE